MVVAYEGRNRELLTPKLRRGLQENDVLWTKSVCGNAKRKILESTEEDTLVTTHVTGVCCQILFNELAKAFLGLPGIIEEERKKLTFDSSGPQGYVEGDVDRGSLHASQICGMIDDIPTCRELIERIVAGAERIIEQKGAKMAQ